jgi:XTP/dITP diphosphohydrolase
MADKPFDRRIVLATHNAGKIREIRELLGPIGFEISSAADFGLEEPEETETTFEGNSALKARHVSSQTGLLALADDSGLAVDGLDGAPGVYTADWAETGNGRDYDQGMARVWSELDALSVDEPRTARFVCVLCLAAPGGECEYFRGEVAGRVIWPPRGTGGFGYDPMFIPAGHDVTFGEMAPKQKSGLSHRRRALDLFLERMGDG